MKKRIAACLLSLLFLGLAPVGASAACQYTLVVRVWFPDAGPMYYPTINVPIQASTCEAMVPEAKVNAELVAKEGLWYGPTYYPSRVIYFVSILLNTNN